MENLTLNLKDISLLIFSPREQIDSLQKKPHHNYYKLQIPHSRSLE